MFTINNIYLNFPFSNQLWWKPDYAQSDANKLLEMLPVLKNSIITLKSNEENDLILKEYSDYYKNEYSMEVLVAENNITIKDYYNFFHQKNAQISTKNLTKILNLQSAVNKLFPDLFIPGLAPKNFNENLAIDINRIIGKDLFEFSGKYRISEAKPSQENYKYLEANRIQDEMNKLFNFTREKFIEFKNLEKSEESLIKLGSQFLAHFLAIHPFQNGNGRVARLLLSYLLSSVTIIPLSIYPKTKNDQRKVYLECLREEQRYKSPATESNLASLILESAYTNLEDICNNLDIYPLD